MTDLLTDHAAAEQLLRTTLAAITPLDPIAAAEARDRQDRLTKPRGALGVLEDLSVQLAGLAAQCPPPQPEPAAVAVFAADHGVHAQGVSPWPQEVTGQMVTNFASGGAALNAFARQTGAHVVVVDIGVAQPPDLPVAQAPSEVPADQVTGAPRLISRRVRPGTADLAVGAAMSPREAVTAIAVGIDIARRLIAAGYRCLVTGDMGIANTTPSAALIAAFTGADAAAVTGRGTGIDGATYARKVDVVRRALDLHRPDPGDALGVVASVGGLEHAAIAGFVLGAAAHRVPVVLDGVIAGAGALVAHALAPACVDACVAGHLSTEPGHAVALEHLGLRPLVDLGMRLGEGTGAVLALPLVQAAVRALREMATFDSAGVTEKAAERDAGAGSPPPAGDAP
jgi:nicotinate-nucleotide--dimethylbenzimidazole phosphoribosyltransferase